MDDTLENNSPRRRLRRLIRSAAALLLIAFLGLNILGFLHARAMLNFAKAGVRTESPRSLSMMQKAGVLLTGVTLPRPQNKRTPESVRLPFETHTVSVGESVKLEVWTVATQELRGVALLFHGYGAAKSSLLSEALAFREIGFEPVLVDFRGSGGSSESHTTIGFIEGEDVAAAVDFARSRNPGLPVVLYGQSMGAAAVLRAIHAHGVQPDAVILEAVFDRLLNTVRNRFALMKLPAFPAAEVLVFWGGVQAGFSGFSHNPIDYAGSCACPTLLLHGAADRNAQLNDARRVQEQLPLGTHLEIFPDVGHSSTYDADPIRWQSAVSEFLTRSGLIKSPP